MNMPFIKIFPRDWAADPQLGTLSYAARGLWWEMICQMHMNDAHRGYLEIAGRPVMEPGQLARVCRGDTAETESLLRELESAGVFSRDERGCIYSRRMVRAEEQSKAGRENGKRGGNPLLKGRGLTEGVNPSPYPGGLGEGLNLDTRYQRSEGNGADAPPAKRPMSVGQRIAIERKLDMLQERRTQLRNQTADRDMRQEHPEKVAELKAVESKLEKLTQLYIEAE